MSTTSGRSSSHELDRFASVRGLADDLDVGRRAQQHREPAAHERLIVGDRDPDHSRLSVGQSGDDLEAAAGARPGFERSAVDADAFAHAQQARARRRTRDR